MDDGGDFEFHCRLVIGGRSARILCVFLRTVDLKRRVFNAPSGCVYGGCGRAAVMQIILKC